jgi:hypothetical protein
LGITKWLCASLRIRCLPFLSQDQDAKRVRVFARSNFHNDTVTD